MSEYNVAYMVVYNKKQQIRKAKPWQMKNSLWN